MTTTSGSAGARRAWHSVNHSNEDVDNDGLLYVVCLFHNQDPGFQIGDTEGVLKGLAQGGRPFEG